MESNSKPKVKENENFVSNKTLDSQSARVTPKSKQAKINKDQIIIDKHLERIIL